MPNPFRMSWPASRKMQRFVNFFLSHFATVMRILGLHIECQSEFFNYLSYIMLCTSRICFCGKEWPGACRGAVKQVKC
jgi:hypothetical protein